MRSPLALALLLACWAASVARAQPAGQAVAEVGEGHVVTVGDLRQYLADRPLELYFSTRDEAYRRALDALVTIELKKIDLFASGLADDRALAASLSRRVHEELVMAYADRTYRDPYLNEDAIREEHARMGRVVQYRQIVLEKPAGGPPEAVERVRATTERIRQELDAGAPFDSLFALYNEDAATARRGGAGIRLTWDQTRTNPFAYILFRLSPGEVRSFEGASHLLVAQVERVDEGPAPPLEAARAEIVEALQGWHALEATRAFRDEWEALVDSTTLAWDREALGQVVEWANTPGFFEGDYRETIARHVAEHGDAQVLQDRLREVRYTDLPRIFDEVLTLSTSGGRDVGYVQDFLLEALRTERLAARARAMGLHEELWRPDTPSPALALAFLDYYNQRTIEDRIPTPTEAALRAFHAAHADSLFYQLETVYTDVITRTDRAEIDSVWAAIQSGVAFPEASSRRLVRSFERTREGEIVSRLNGEPPYLGDVAFGLEVGEIAGPVEYVEEGGRRVYAVVRATRREAERVLPFEEIRDRVEEAFLEHHRERLAAEVAADLRARYPVTIHHDVLTEASR